MIIINIETISAIFLHLKANPTIDEKTVNGLIAHQLSLTSEQAQQWLTVFYNGLYQALILTKPDFASLKDRALSITEAQLQIAIVAITEYAERNPPPYVRERELKRINAEIAEVQKQPDEILMPNDTKFSQLFDLEEIKNRWLQ